MGLRPSRDSHVRSVLNAHYLWLYVSRVTTENDLQIILPKQLLMEACLFIKSTWRYLGEICDTFVTDLMLDFINFKCVSLLVCWLRLKSKILTKYYKTEAYVGFYQGSHDAVFMPVPSPSNCFLVQTVIINKHTWASRGLRNTVSRNKNSSHSRNLVKTCQNPGNHRKIKRLNLNYSLWKY